MLVDESSFFVPYNRCHQKSRVRIIKIVFRVQNSIHQKMGVCVSRSLMFETVTGATRLVRFTASMLDVAIAWVKNTVWLSK